MTKRSEELDRMSEDDKAKDILKNLAEHGCLRIYGRQSLGFWSGALSKLEDEGRIATRIVDEDSQSSYLKVTLKETP